jgi:putative membrane protein
MFIEILIAILVGVSCGIFTGLTPGLHINLVAAILLSYSPILLAHINPICLVVFVIAMSVTHTFLDMIPSIFLGAPEEATALGVLPGHRFLLKGEGYTALKLAIMGSLGATILSILFFPIYLLTISFYPAIKDYIGYFLLAVIGFMILRERKKLWAVFVFVLAGLFGLIVLNMANLNDPLLPMLSGVFGISTLIVSLNKRQSLPLQKPEQTVMLKKGTLTKALFSGQLSGFVTAVFPGLSSSIAAVMSLQITRKLGDNGFMVLIGSIGTANFIISMATLVAIDKARNGTIVAVQSLIKAFDVPTIMVFLCVTLITAGISVYLGLKIGKMFCRLVELVSYRKLVVGIIALIALMVALTSGCVGILILAVSTAIGIIPALAKVSRTHAMGCIMLPVITYYF